MKLFIDTFSIDEIKQALETGLLSGLTTNPYLLSQKKDLDAAHLKTLCSLVPGPCSLQVLSETAEEMVMQGETFASWAPNVVVKIPLTREGLKAAKNLLKQDIKVNMTFCFSPLQAMLAAEIGATYVSPFMGKLEDTGEDPFQLIEDIRILFDTHDFETNILAASIRHPLHAEGAALRGADAATMPPKVFWDLCEDKNASHAIQAITPLYGKLQKALLT